MGNIIDYVKWRGDITFQEQPFNHVDNLVCAVLSYIDFEGDCGQSKRENGYNQRRLSEIHGTAWEKWGAAAFS